MLSKDIFSSLSKYASVSEENYLTEAFVFLLNFLLIEDKLVVLEILNHLCVPNNEFSFDENENIVISTQMITEEGVPDIVVASPDKLIYIEVKYDSPVGSNQLKRYKKDLGSQSAAIKQLILLTKFPVDFSEHEGIPDKLVRWFEAYNLLVVAKDRVEDPVSVYLIDAFKSFLEVKQMSIQKVGWEYINGMPAMNNLINMIDVAIQALPVSKYWKSARWQHRGFYIEDNKLWCGIHYNNPLVVTFEMIRKEKFDLKAAKKTNYALKEGRERIWFRLPLEDLNFFSLDKDKQIEEITRFVKTAYTETQRMRIKEK
jgi:hypothetical protein